MRITLKIEFDNPDGGIEVGDRYDACRQALYQLSRLNQELGHEGAAIRLTGRYGPIEADVTLEVE